MKRLIVGVVAVLTGISGFGAENMVGMQSQNEGMVAPRAPGKVVVDGDGDSLGWDLAADGKTAAHFEMKFPAGRLMVFRSHQLDGWEAGISEEHDFTVTPVISAPTKPKAKPELRIGSICTATLVPDAQMLAETRAADEAASAALKAKRAAADLEKLDHGRGKKGGEAE